MGAKIFPETLKPQITEFVNSRNLQLRVILVRSDTQRSQMRGTGLLAANTCQHEAQAPLQSSIQAKDN